jgi:proteasome lid subunit RPN8/RPN11
MINIQPGAREVMVNDAISSYPYECCGFFYGNEDATGNRVISDVLIVNNAKEGDKRRRFEISPRDYVKAEQFADENNLHLLGVYHSHPNHLPAPSEHDRQAAQIYFSYIIISVYNKELNKLRSWRLNDSFQFEEEEILEPSEALISDNH